MTRAAIVGCGGIAQVHAAALAQIPGVTLAACADIRPERARALAEGFGGQAYDSLEAMLDAERPDALHICTPHPLHTPMAALAAKRGVAVLTEKPPVVTLAQWEAFAALRGQAPVGICFQNRYSPPVRFARDLMQSGQAGAPRGGRAFVSWHRDAAYYTESGWRGTWETEGGGALINQAIHTLDLLVHLLGKPSRHETHMANHTLKGVIEVEDTVDAFIDFGGVPALFHATNAYCADAPVFVEIACEQVTLRLTPNTLTCRWADGREERPALDLPEAMGKGYWGNGHLPCIADFYACLAEGKPFPIGIRDVEDTMLLAISMYDPYRGKVV